MNIKGVSYIVAALLLIVFMLANWALLVGNVELNLLIARIQAPLGVLIMLIGAIILLIDLGVHAATRRSWMRERKALQTDLEAARIRAENEEASRTNALRITVERELATIRAQLDRLSSGQAATSDAVAHHSPSTPFGAASGDPIKRRLTDP